MGRGRRGRRRPTIWRIPDELWVLLKATLLAPVNPVPVRVTAVPAGPPPGVTEVMVEAATGKVAVLVAVPPGLVSVMVSPVRTP